MGWLLYVVTLLVWVSTLQTIDAILPQPPVRCDGTVCIVDNAYGIWGDRKDCYVNNVVYPTTEEELRLAVAYANKNKLKVNIVSKFSHSVPKLICPSTPNHDSTIEDLIDDVEVTAGAYWASLKANISTELGSKSLLISTAKYDSNIEVDSENLVVTADAGVSLRELIDKVEEAGLSLVASTYWEGVSVAGVISTGAHGSSLWGKGGAIHEQVIGISLVVPATKSEGYAKVIQLGAENDEHLLNAAKVSLGLLGVISKVKFSLERGFKRSIVHHYTSDANMEDEYINHAKEYEFGDIIWYPSKQTAVYRRDSRVSMDTPGDGINDYVDVQPSSILFSQTVRVREQQLESARDVSAKCALADFSLDRKRQVATGLKNNGQNFTEYPVIGRQGKMQTAGSCLYATEDDVSCVWDPRNNGVLYFETSAMISATKFGDFIRDVKKLREVVNPENFCGMDLYFGFLIRFIKASTAYLGQSEDSVAVDFAYYRADDALTPRLNQDIMEEIEQMAFFKYGGRPHWAKNRDLAFFNVKSKYPNYEKFVAAKKQLDPQNMFSSEWSEKTFGEDEDVVSSDGCAMEGLCVCSEDRHCNPSKGYFCKPGRVYSEAKVCRFSPSSME
ncbi:hypothetical protein COLO4_18676 [Corchorus olitorius]|uniref:L-gulonolactone oxidase n=1 Tax=Corchorus olitorius TaxID=93759 RepID=A0A1R3J8E6_9ROSI|nr:hypothetical protein COLO4_18676 [Corchorus olitorius]